MSENELYEKIIVLLNSMNFKLLCDTVYKLYEVSEDKDKIAVIVKLLNYMRRVDKRGQDIISDYNSRFIASISKSNMSVEEDILYNSSMGYFTAALTYIADYKKLYGPLSNYYLILTSLNKINRRKNLNLNNYLMAFVTKDDIESIYVVLEGELEKRELTSSYKALITVSNDYLLLREHDIMPVAKPLDKECDLYELINSKNYKQAKSFIQSTNKNCYRDALYLTICVLVDKMERFEAEYILTVKDDILFKLRCIVDFPSSTIYNLDDVAKIFEFSDEEKLLYNLVLAEKCYKERNELIGDRFIKLVEKNKNKTMLVNYVLNEIKKCKKLCLNKGYELVSK